ncbi:nucleoside deaminase [bacterium]|nr:nucleoside deaminase [bacterium]
MIEKNFDKEYIKKCISLANQAYNVDKDVPFACIIVRKDEIVAIAKNRATKGDITRHAEILAIQEAQKILDSSDLSECTLYSNVEPCPMCSFMIRESRIAKVCFSLSSPKMGGYSKWPILQDEALGHIYPFSKPPKIVKGILKHEAKRDFEKLGWVVFSE